MCIEDVLQVGRNAFDIIIVFVGRIEEMVRERHNLIFADQFHEHVLRRADEIVGIAKGQHVVEVFVCAERRIFDMDPDAVGFLVPLFKVFDQRLLTENIAGRKINFLVFSPAAFVNVFFPVADAQGHFLFPCGSALRGAGIDL